MRTVAEVRLWGRSIGAVALDTGRQVASFEYDPAFARSSIEIAPLTMPLANLVYAFPALSQKTFYGLPGLLADSLPDRFGNALINAWLASQGRSSDSFNAVERLCYTGRRGMGALEYAPANGPRARQATRIRIDHLVTVASQVLTQRTDLPTTFGENDKKATLQDILQVGTSAGGARAKAVIAWNPVTNEVRSGQVPTDPGYEHWLIKFDGVSGNRDKERADPKGFGIIEYAYYRMARDAGITMNECRLLEESGRSHFMTRRFDRLADGEKMHMQSLGALAHFDFNLAGVYGYEQGLRIIRQLGMGMNAVEELYRRMVFNILARNQDDHVKNIAFLMNKAGSWSLAPAFDLTYSFQPTGHWTSIHQMTLNGKRDGFTLEDFRACAKSAYMKRGRAEAILREVHAVVSRWPEYADATGVSADWRNQITGTLRLKGFA